MTQLKRRLEDLAIFGGAPLFQDHPRSTANLVRPDIEKFLAYSRQSYSAQRFTDQGPLANLLEARLAAFHETQHCVTFSSCFWALVLTIRATALPERTEVVMPSLTYRRLSDIVAWTGLVPRYGEVDEFTLAIDPASAASCINERTALLLAVHTPLSYCDVPALEDLSRRSGVPLLFDAVEAVYQTVGGKRVGGNGRAECFSLHASKLVNGIEGGYLTTNDAALASRLAALRTLDQVEGEAELYAINAGLPEMHAAAALASLDELSGQLEKNLARYRAYQRLLADLPGIRLVAYDEAERTGYKNIGVELTEDWPLTRDATVALLNAERILARAYYAPAQHQKPHRYPTVPATLPLTDRLSERFILMPCGHFVTEEDIAAVVALLRFVGANGEAVRERAADEAIAR